MAFKDWRPWIRLGLASALSAAFTALAALAYGNWPAFFTCVLAAICSYAYIFRLYRNVRRNVAFVLDAVENGDFAFRYTTKATKTSDSEVNAYLNRIIDILERYSDDIRQTDLYYEVILNSIDNGVIILDREGNVLHSNRAARKLLRTDVLANVRHLSRVHPSLPALLTSENLPSAINLHSGSGDIALSVTRSRLSLRGKTVDAIALSDISRSMDSKELESWSSLTRVLTHEIMNSLTPVISICESLLTDPEATAVDYNRGLQTVASTGKSLKRFVNNFRSLSNIPTPQPAPFYAKPFLERMRDICMHQFPALKADVAILCKPADLMLYADEQLVGLAVTNILKNAMQAVAETERPEIMIDARLLPDEAVRIEISNNGPIISPEAASQIFLPFFTTKPDGSGIGLSMAKRIMAASNGSITLRALPRTSFILTFS